MKTPPAATFDLEAAMPAGSAAVAAQQPSAHAANKVAEHEEDPRLRCAFVRKIYGILTLQFVLTAAVAATACFVRPVRRFFAYGPPAAVWPAFIVILVSPLVSMFPMLKDRDKHPTRNRVLLALFSLCFSFSVAVSAFATVADMAILQPTILTVLGLTLFAIWAAKMGYDYNFSDTFACLLTCLISPLAYIIVVIPFPLKMVGIAICGFLATLLFSGFYVVVCDLDDKDGDDYNGDGSDDDDSGSFVEQRV